MQQLPVNSLAEDLGQSEDLNGNSSDCSGIENNTRTIEDKRNVKV